MLISQRSGGGVLVASGAATQFCVDRWVTYAGAGSSIFTVQRVSVTGSGSGFGIRLTKPSGVAAGSFVVGTALESSSSQGLAGQQVTLSFKARKGATYTGSAKPIQNIYTGTGTDQSISGPIVGGATWTGGAPLTLTANSNPDLTTSLQQYSFTGTCGADVTQIGCFIGCTASASTGSATDFIDIADVQLEIGSVDTPFEQRPYGLELALCQRYYSVFSYLVIFATGNYTQATFPVTMRTAPTIAGGAAGFAVSGANSVSLSCSQTALAAQTITCTAEL
jgi:hypothetical protein